MKRKGWQFFFSLHGFARKRGLHGQWSLDSTQSGDTHWEQGDPSWKGGDSIEMGDMCWERRDTRQEDVTHCQWGDTYQDGDVTHWEGGDTSQGGGDTGAVECVSQEQVTLAGKEVMDVKKGVTDIEKGVTHARKDTLPIRGAGQGHASHPSSCRGHRAARMALVGSSMARSCGDRHLSCHTCVPTCGAAQQAEMPRGAAPLCPAAIPTSGARAVANVLSPCIIQII